MKKNKSKTYFFLFIVIIFFASCGKSKNPVIPVSQDDLAGQAIGIYYGQVLTSTGNGNSNQSIKLTKISNVILRIEPFAVTGTTVIKESELGIYLDNGHLKNIDQSYDYQVDIDLTKDPITIQYYTNPMSSISDYSFSGLRQ